MGTGRGELGDDREHTWPAARTALPGDADWPRGLASLDPGGPDAGAARLRAVHSLRVCGALPFPERGVVAIVGTRAADEEACHFARTLARAIARAGLVVISGGARGIDAAAHEGALDVGGMTVVVFGSGLAQPYPTANLGLFTRVLAAGGAVVSEQPDPTPPHAGLFLARNRIVAAWAEDVVVVQAPARSGALATAAAAASLGRRVWAVPAAPWDPRGAGANALLRRGARFLTCAEDLLGGRVAPGAPAGDQDRPPAPRTTHLGADADAVFAFLAGRAREVDDIVRAVHLPPPRVLGLLAQLELGGLVARNAAGLYRQAVGQQGNSTHEPRSHRRGRGPRGK